MTSEPLSEAWTRIRYDYEHTDRPVEDICAEHGISSGTLRDRMRRWGWTRRRPPIPRDGPPPASTPQVDMAPLASSSELPIEMAAPLLSAAAQAELAEPSVEAAPDGAADQSPGAARELDSATIARGLQRAAGRVLPAIETIIVQLGARPMHPREMERAARALSALTRTLRELNGLLERHAAPAAHDDMPEDIDEFRRHLARRIRLFVESRTGKADSNARPDAGAGGMPQSGGPC